MAEFKAVLRKTELAPGSGRSVQVNGKAIAVFNVNGTFRAVDDSCPHKGGPLGEGSLDGDVVTCPWHGWRYDVPTGRAKDHPSCHIKIYEVRVDGDDVLISL